MAGQARRASQPLQIKSVELNWVKRLASHERLMGLIGFGSCEVLAFDWGLIKQKRTINEGLIRQVLTISKNCYFSP